ncbi:hypothetical protein PVW47_08780 [Marinovum sp. SP66]|uniref:S8 family serine peptidase n=1 Tax=Marinovum TaxID=367771 RepID=UPI00237A892B|nr:hypothetical protein [Marinovum sp. SP66]MDD9739867.1 hypothetical protein [Marinovum sp. SP66]
MDKSSALQRLTGIKKVERLRALPPGSDAAPSAPDIAQRELGTASQEAQADLQTLQAAGWTFGPPESAPDDRAFEVVMDTDGHLKLAGRALTVKINPDLSPERVAELLAELGFKVRRELGFAPNTFLIEAEGQSGLEAAKSLNERPEVLYAEPNLVEAMQTRR